MKARSYQECVRCVMDTTDPDIEFDEKGLCNHCKRYFVRAGTELLHHEEGQKKVNALVEKMKEHGRGKDYDCVIGVSGGVDSTMVAYIVKKKYGLRPLAIHFDNGWNSELAVSNIEKTLKTLGIDLYTYVVDWEEFKDIQLSFLKASVANAEVPTDHAIGAILYKLACEKGIKYIISGSNIETEAIMPKAWGYDNRDYRHLKCIHKKFGKVKIKTFPHYGLFDFFYFIFLRGLRFVRILNAAPYNKKEALKILENELGWVNYGGKHYESIFTRFFQAYILPHKFGFDKRRAHYSTLICAGQMSREEAKEALKVDPYPKALLEQDKEYVIKKLGLTEAEFEAIMKLPPKTHKDYPSNDFIFNNEKAGLLSFVKRVALGA